MWHPTTSSQNSFGNYFAPRTPQNLFYGYDFYGFPSYSYPCRYFDRSYLNALPQCSSGPFPPILGPAPQITSCNDSSVNNQPLSTGKELLFTPFSESRMDDPELFLSTIKSHFATNHNRPFFVFPSSPCLQFWWGGEPEIFATWSQATLLSFSFHSYKRVLYRLYFVRYLWRNNDYQLEKFRP